MQVKDQIKLRMNQLGLTIEDIAGGMDLSEQTVRHWLSGRNFPGKRHTTALEAMLNFKLDFSEGESDDLSPLATSLEEIARSLDEVDLQTMQAMARLPKNLRHQVSMLVRSMSAQPSSAIPN